MFQSLFIQVSAITIYCENKYNDDEKNSGDDCQNINERNKEKETT